jgi:hypothetical protein
MAIEMTQLGCTEVVLEPFSAVVVQRHRSLPRIFPPNLAPSPGATVSSMGHALINRLLLERLD